MLPAFHLLQAKSLLFMSPHSQHGLQSPSPLRESWYAASASHRAPLNEQCSGLHVSPFYPLFFSCRLHVQ